MTDRPIPPEIRDRAINLADTIILEREVNGQTEGYTNWVVGMISAALLSLQEETEKATRERCAEIAEGCGYQMKDDGYGIFDPMDVWYNKAVEDIVAAIRREPIMQELADEAQKRGEYE